MWKLFRGCKDQIHPLFAKGCPPSRLMAYVSMLGSGTVSEGKEADNGNNNTVAVAVLHWSWCSLEDAEELPWGGGILKTGS